METILELLNLLEDLLEQSSTMPFTGKVMVNRDELLDIITDIRLKLPNEIKQSKWVLEERNKILIDAQKEADTIIKEGGSAVNKLVDEHEITKLAKVSSEKIIAEAKYTAKEMRLGAIEYADEVLALMQTTMNDSMESTNKQSQEMLALMENVINASKEAIYNQIEKNQQFYNSNLDVIYHNRQELRGK